MSSKKDGKGACELNKHDISLINENSEFVVQKGVTFSMLVKVNMQNFMNKMIIIVLTDTIQSNHTNHNIDLNELKIDST